jgi:HEAT repeat protein
MGFFDLTKETQLYLLKIILKKLPTVDLLEILLGKVAPLQVIAVLGIPIDAITSKATNPKVMATRNLFYQLAHEEFFDRHQPKDITYQSQLLCSWLIQLSAGKELSFIDVELLKSIFSHPKSSFEVRLYCSLLINKRQNTSANITPRIVDMIIENTKAKNIPDADEIQWFGSQFTIEQRKVLLDTLHSFLQSNRQDLRNTLVVKVQSLFPILSNFISVNPQHLHFRGLTVSALMGLYPFLSNDLDKTRAFNFFVSGLNSNETLIRAASARALGSLAPSLSKSEDKILLLNSIRTLLDDDYETAREYAANTLGIIYPALPSDELKEEVINALLGDLFHDNVTFRQTAAITAGVLYPSLPGCEKSQVFESLLENMAHEDETTRLNALNALGRLFPFLIRAEEKTRVFDALSLRLSDDQSSVREASASTIGSLGPFLENHQDILLQAIHTLFLLSGLGSLPLRPATLALVALCPFVSNEITKRNIFNTLSAKQATDPAMAKLYLSLPIDIDKIKVFDALLLDLADADLSVRQDAVSSLGTLYPLLSHDEHKERLLHALLLKLNADDWNLRQTTISALDVLIPSLSNNHLHALIAFVGKLNNGKPSIGTMTLSLIAGTQLKISAMNQPQESVEMPLLFSSESSSGSSSKALDSKQLKYMKDQFNETVAKFNTLHDRIQSEGLELDEEWNHKIAGAQSDIGNVEAKLMNAAHEAQEPLHEFILMVEDLEKMLPKPSHRNK